ncbi:unnamed protein product [Heligmosomoides polygyrus]|uniref:RING-type E3 ubiquitin transferase n=1 Tax=Heligmosomoides polygyrus TaxID=6339 RepID=A0A183FEP4_HELPZ|nr:unnamed protein product [Heligmosomoides polygyrus]
MGGRQSSVAEDRPRSNSVLREIRADQHIRNEMNRKEFQEEKKKGTKLSRKSKTLKKVGSSSESSGSEDDAGPSNLHQHPMMLRSHGGLSFNHARSGRLRSVEDMVCPICHETVPSVEADVHLVMCLTTSKITYNDDILTENKGECSICLEEMLTGVARLPCLCIYHKQCIDDWLKRKSCCPEHPGDD